MTDTNRFSSNFLPMQTRFFSNASIPFFFQAVPALTAAAFLAGTSVGSAAAPAVGAPLDLKFKSVEGKTVDLAELKGKVVLIDFWATWCGPCVAEVPHVKATYEKFRNKGFEIVGISLDKDKSRLEAFVKGQGMTWPQYFDGKGWENEISAKYGIESIPTMWLVDKEGKIADLNARRDLEGKVSKLLGK